MLPLMTTGQALRAQSAKRPGKILAYHHGDSYTYSDIVRLADGFSQFLLASGVKPGDRVCLLLPRTPELLIAFIGASQIGVWPAPVNYLVSPAEVNAFIGKVGPAVIVATDKLYPILGADMVSRKGLKVVVTGAEVPGAIPWASAVAGGGAPFDTVTDPQSVAYLNYTTGSTGSPKGALATHANIYWNTLASVEAFGIGENDVHLCMFASFAHPHELFARPIWTGGSMVLLEEISPKAVTRAVSGHSVSCVMGLAPMYRMMTEHRASLKIPSLRIAESGGMYTMPDINRDFIDSFGVPIYSVWGSTETTGIAVANTPGAHRVDGSMGKPCPHYEVAVLDHDGAPIVDGEVGEMAVRSGAVISGYYENGGASISEGGWYRTGDLVRRDHEGFLYFVERKSGMLKIAGLKAYPLQIELTLMEHPSVALAAVIGVEDKLRGVAPVAFITIRPGRSVTEDEIKAFVRNRMAAYMAPRKVEIVDDLPRIGSGKVNKMKLKESYLKTIGVAQ
ncbi:MAG: acyl--CoA ligase [Nitrospinae bacterium]|nr:acyl--CoA ligase [Nitrospinota bacterium]